VLLTGAAGFIGSHLAEALLARGEAVVAIDDLNDFYDPAIKRRNLATLRGRPGFRCYEGDIRDRELVASVFRSHSPKRMVHLAAMAGVRPSIERPALYTDVNLNGTAVLLEEGAKRGLAKVVFASSSSVYGERSDPPFREEDRVDHPISPYAATKKGGELLCHSFHVTTGLTFSVVRYFTVYGPRQRPEMAIHKFCRMIDAGEAVPVFGDGSSARDYTYIDDIVAGSLAALDRCEGYRVFNLGGSSMTTLAGLLDLLAELTGREVRIERKPVQAGDVSLTSACVDRAERELGYRPRTDLREGIRRFIAWRRGNAS
jgi:UDP-glucuronate 4-epimerase